MNVPIEEVEAILLQNKIDQTKVQTIVQDLTKVVEELAEDRKAQAGPKQKWEYVIVLNDTDGLLKDKEIGGWVVQQKEGEDAGTVVSKLCDAARTQNESAKRKKNTITDLLGLFESLKSKFAKEKNLRVKTKDLSRVLITNGKMI